MNLRRTRSTPSTESRRFQGVERPRPKQVHCIVRGTSQITTGQEAIRTVVGAGIAVVVYLADGNGGGVANLPVPNCGVLPEDETLDPAERSKLIHFLDELDKGPGITRGATAEIIGAADVLRFLPARERDRRALRRASAIESILETRRISVHRIEVGGEISRRIVADFKQGVTNIITVTCSGAPAIRTTSSRPPPPLRLVAGASRVTVDMGKLKVARAPNQLVSVLGSCVGIALHDPVTRVGGLAHAMLPQYPAGAPEPNRYVDTAVAMLVKLMVAEGARDDRLRAHIIGGAEVLFRPSKEEAFRLGKRNLEAARRTLKAANIPVLEEASGGRFGRKLIFDLATFTLTVKTLKPEHSE